jgi:predicted ribosomally synthesized peptide with nif11-like leader
MSKESLEKFAHKLEQDQEWGNQFGDLNTEEIVARAGGEGFDFTAEEFDAATTEVADGELSEDDLENVAGGGLGSMFRPRFKGLGKRPKESFDMGSKHSVTEPNDFGKYGKKRKG